MPNLLLGDVMAWQARRGPGRVAIVCDEQSITRAELETFACELAREFEGLGVEPNRLVAIALPNGVEFYAATFATWKLGAIPLPVNYRLPEREMLGILEIADPALVIGKMSSEALGYRCFEPVFEPGRSLGEPEFPGRVGTYSRALTSGGSTGRPKVIMSHAEPRVDPEVPSLGMQPDTKQLVPGPLHHNAPFVTSTNGLLHGATVVVMKRFDPLEMLRLIEEHRIEWVQVVPTMLHRIWRLPESVRASTDMSSLNVVFSTGGAFPAWLKAVWGEWIGYSKIVEIYGSSEGYGSTIVSGDEPLLKPGTVGRPRETAPRILDPDNLDAPPLPVGEVGLIYFEQPTEQRFHYIGAERSVHKGWETLGDMGYLDEDGYLFIADRRVDMIVTGGENVFPAEVEAALEQHPDVRSSAVIGLPDDDLGQRVHAIVDTGVDGGSPAELDASDLQQHLAEWLVRYKIPRSFEFVVDPLRSDAGKVRRSALRAERLSGRHG